MENEKSVVEKKSTRIMVNVLITLLGLVCALLSPSTGFSADVPANFSGGSGSKEDPYLISNAQDLVALAERVSLEEKNCEQVALQFGVLPSNKRSRPFRDFELAPHRN